MPRRASLDDALRGDEPEPPFAGELQHAPRHPMEPPGAAPEPPEPETYKLTVVLTEEEHQALERLTEVVIAEVAPRRVGKGWRTKSIRMLLELVGDSPSLQSQVAAALKHREGRAAERAGAERRRTR
jgi:hypothetical protein